MEKLKGLLEGALGLVIVLAVLAVGIAIIAIGWAGIEHRFGGWWGWAAVIAGVLFRFTLPLVVGVFYCARDIWGWHWALALLLAAPGLVFMIPGLVAALWGALRRR